MVINAEVKVAKFMRYLPWFIGCTYLLVLKYSSILPQLDCTLGSGPRIRFLPKEGERLLGELDLATQ